MALDLRHADLPTIVATGLPQWIALFLTVAAFVMIVATALLLWRKPTSTFVAVEALVERRRHRAGGAGASRSEPAAAEDAGPDARAPGAPAAEVASEREPAPPAEVASEPEPAPRAEVAKEPEAAPPAEVASEPEPAPEPIEPVPLPEPEPAHPPADEPSEAAAATPQQPAPAPSEEPAEAVPAEAVPVEATPAAPPPSATEVPAEPARRPRSATHGGAARAKPRTAPAQNGPICQVRWLGKGRGSCFSAVMVDADGVEHSVATSRRVEWRGSAPPDENPESQAALRQLSKILRESGWRPMRGRGKDFKEERWYARRFRLVEAETPVDEAES